MFDNKKLVISLSAGSINLCNYSICSKDEDFNTTQCYQGLGLCDFSFEPHFNINNEDVLKELIEISNRNRVVAFEDDALCIIQDEDIMYYGNVYEIKSGMVHKCS